MRRSNTVDLINVEAAMRLRCEALKLPASATDPLSGKIDVPIQCENARKRRHQEKEGESSKKMATDATGQEQICQDPKTGKGKSGNGLRAKNETTFRKVNTPEDQNYLSDVVTNELTLPGKIFRVKSGRTFVKSVLHECIRVSINFPEANMVKVGITGRSGHVETARKHIASWICQV